MNFKTLLQLDDINYLKEISVIYPEIKALLKKSPMATPAGPALLSSNALAYKVFEKSEVDDSAIEIERTFLSLLLFKAVFNNNNSKFPNINEDNFKLLSNFINDHIKSEEELAFIIYSLACNDLGKTQVFSHSIFTHCFDMSFSAIARVFIP